MQETIDVIEFLDIEHTNEVRQEAQELAALILSWGV